MVGNCVKRIFLAGVLPLLIALSALPGHICFSETPQTIFCDSAGNMQHHQGGHAPNKCFLCDSDLHACSITFGLNKEKAASVPEPSTSLIPAYTGISMQIASIYFNPDIHGVSDYIDALRQDLRPIYLKNLSLRC